MSESLITAALAGLLGTVVAAVLAWWLPTRRKLRIALLVAVPPAALVTVFLLFFDGAPLEEDWIWLLIGLSFFWPWYLAWGVGCIAASVAVARIRQRRG